MRPGTKYHVQWKMLMCDSRNIKKKSVIIEERKLIPPLGVVIYPCLDDKRFSCFDPHLPRLRP